MSSISPQAVVERASAEISKRINGLGLRTKSHHHASGSSSAAATNTNTATFSTTTSASSSLSSSTSSSSATSMCAPAAAITTTSSTILSIATTAGMTTATAPNTGGNKTSVMERVTNVLCGGNFSVSQSKNSITNINNADKQQQQQQIRNINNNNNNSISSPSNSNVSNVVAPNMSTNSHHHHHQHHLITNTISGVGVVANNYNQLQAQIAGSTLVQSNNIGGPCVAIGANIGAPPAPSVTSIAKQMNIAIPNNTVIMNFSSSNVTSLSSSSVSGSVQNSASSSSASLSSATASAAAAASSSSSSSINNIKQSNRDTNRKSIIAHHPYATPSMVGMCLGGTTAGADQQTINNNINSSVVTTNVKVINQQQQQQQMNVVAKVYNHVAMVQTIPALMLDDRFLNRFFLYFNANERRLLAQVCLKWRDILYRTPRYWFGLVPVLPCRELRQMSSSERTKIYNSLMRRGFRALTLVGTSDEDALDIVHSFPLATKHVHSLTLRCSSISDRGLEALLDHLQSLFELELSGCNEVTEAGLWACLTPRIVSLSLNDCINIADEAIGAVAQLLPSLYEFSLQAYHVTDAALGYFSPKQSHSLSILRLQSCWELTNHGIVNIVHSLPHLTVLSLSGCSKLTDDGVELIAENLQKLRALDLSWCPRVTDASLEYIACDLNHLEELTLDRCIHITDIGVGYISTMLTLTTLFLRWCSQVRDFGLQHLCSMRNLQVLSLAGCPLLTSSGLSSLIQLRHLQELELTNCPGASHELFEYLKEHLPHCLIIE